MDAVAASAEARRFGKYTLVAKLATGGMAEIFLARLQGVGGFEKLVCIKRILPHLAKDHHFVQMFLDEARVGARISTTCRRIRSSSSEWRCRRARGCTTRTSSRTATATCSRSSTATSRRT